MSTNATTETAGRAAFISNRLASILAFAPLGVWTVNHLWDNLAVFESGAAWQREVTGHEHQASLAFTTFFLALGPLVLHTVWGIRRLWTSRPNNKSYGFFANFRYLIQRLSAVGVLLFLGAHIWLAFLRPRILEGRPEPFVEIAAEMHWHGPTLIVYTLGTLGVAYHLANGVYGAAMGWGVAVSRAALRKLETFVYVLFVALLAMSWAAVYGLWRAGSTLPPPADVPDPGANVAPGPR